LLSAETFLDTASVCVQPATSFKYALFYQAERYKREMFWKMKAFCVLHVNRQGSDVEPSRLSKVSLWYEIRKVQNESRVYTIIQHYSLRCNSLHCRK